MELAKASVPQGLARASSIALNWRVLWACAGAAAVRWDVIREAVRPLLSGGTAG